MLYGNMKEARLNASPSKNNNNSLDQGNDIDDENIIKIPDVTYEAFKYLMSYISGLSKEISYKDKNIPDILYMAKKYLIKPIEIESIYALRQHFLKMKSIEQVLNCINKMCSIGLKVQYAFLRFALSF